ncbi:hypothetical protein NUU61_001075 [Penicillium alfredii]|uniref:F-box domain-containing protein n=1 Tax=Penicillium alfredii TaxID=1506179 RepID=A0A9W9GAS9_9EURO|nr:uncharacterized protein NUU61_001075 [Penicillium alfredii]KAJ5115316.1 hypothetical protein NUU61_001075 [Penicillium alfredii]
MRSSESSHVGPPSSHLETLLDKSTAPRQTTTSQRETGGTIPFQHDRDNSSQPTAYLPSAANTAPPEILLQIYSMLTPRDFDNARRTCSQWMRVSLNHRLLQGMLRRAGWWDAWQQDCERHRTSKRPAVEESEAWRMSKRFATECLLSGRKTNVEKPGFLVTTVVDFSSLSQTSPAKSRRVSSHTVSQDARPVEPRGVSMFTFSGCGRYLLVTTGCMIYVYSLRARRARSTLLSVDSSDADLAPIASIACQSEVLSVTMDTSTAQPVVAALLRSRVGMVCDLNVQPEKQEDSESGNPAPTAGPVGNGKSSPSAASINQSSRHMPIVGSSSRHYFHNVCSPDAPPQTVTICPGRRCVAFGCASGVEIHWVDETSHCDQRKRFPMSQPSEILHFLPNRPDMPTELRLISSLAGPGILDSAGSQSPLPSQSKKTQFHLLADVQSLTRRRPSNGSTLSLVRATHCHHYRAVPINDGFHIIFIEPRTGLLCIGSDAPIGGPTSLTRAFVCVPPSEYDAPDANKEARMPSIFVAGSDLRWGLRVVAAYQDRIVLYSIPLDVFNVIRKERERQGDGVMGDSDLARDWFVDSERSRKRRESLVQNQNGDWEFLLSVSYRPTAMMWPFKIYGKEIGRVDRLIELALQSSDGGARIWAFSASGEATVFDVDTFSSPNAQSLADIPCSSLKVAADGSLEPTRLVERRDSTRLMPLSSRKRKFAETRDHFSGRYGAALQTPGFALDASELVGAGPTGTHAAFGDSSSHRTSFAACIVDFKIPELGPREGRWRESPRRGSRAACV